MHSSIYSLLIILLCVFEAYSQSISGTVKNGNENVIDAIVRIKATDNFVYTNSNGEFSLTASSTDSIFVNSWKEGFFNGETKVFPGDSNVVIQLHELPSTDNEAYQFLSPFSDEGNELNCQNCHVDTLMNQWKNNAHGQSAKNPFFFAMYNGTDINGNDAGVGFKKDFASSDGNCAMCHIPSAAINNPYGVNPNNISGVDTNGVFCDFCHKMYNTNTDYLQKRWGVLSIDLIRPEDGEQMFFGPYDDIHEPDAFLPLIKRSEFCAPCHSGFFWNTLSYGSFPEWQESPYPDMGIQCQTCHMAPDGVTTNFAHLSVGGMERDPMNIPSHLQPGSRDENILQNALTMTTETEFSNDSLIVRVILYNDLTGHHVPTDRPSRNMILLVNPLDENGNRLEQIGGDKVPRWGGEGDEEEGNYADLPGKGFAKLMIDNLTSEVPSPAWRSNYVLEDNRIAAFESDTSEYIFRLPDGESTITTRSKLWFRRFYKQWMDEKEFEIPDILMESDSLVDNVIVSGTEDKIVPTEFALYQNYPNPFNPSTTINYTVGDANIASPTNVILKVFDILGNEVATLVNEKQSPGKYSVTWNASHLSSGVYIYSLKTGSYSASKKLVLMK